MNTTYLKSYLEHKIAFLPLGTTEWHGNHLPLETDVIVAEEITKKITEQIPGFVLPGVWSGTFTEANGLRGMSKYIGKTLPGEIYCVEPGLFYQVVNSMVNNLKRDFERIVIITGHGGSKQVEMLQRIEQENNAVVFINPYNSLAEHVPHGGAEETSILWACCPEQEKISRSINIPIDDDYFKWAGYDPRERASIEKGQELLKIMVADAIKKIQKTKQ